MCNIFIYMLFFGWIIDVSIVLVSDGVLENRGFLFEPICPMYGFAALVLIAISKKINGKGGNIKKFIMAIICCSVLEYITSLVLEVCFGIRWWDYSKEPYNFQGRVCIAASVFWGLLSIIFMKNIHPFIEKKVKKVSSKISKKNKEIIVMLILCGTLVDLIVSVCNYLNI